MRKRQKKKNAKKAFYSWINSGEFKKSFRQLLNDLKVKLSTHAGV
jgi:hypothetical protein